MVWSGKHNPWWILHLPSRSFLQASARLLIILQLVRACSRVHVHLPFVSDTTSFSFRLDGRRTAPFSQFLLKLGRRCVDSADLPSENNFKDKLDLDSARSTGLSVPKFLGRIQLGEEVVSSVQNQSGKRVTLKEEQREIDHEETHSHDQRLFRKALPKLRDACTQGDQRSFQLYHWHCSGSWYFRPRDSAQIPSYTRIYVLQQVVYNLPATWLSHLGRRIASPGGVFVLCGRDQNQLRWFWPAYHRNFWLSASADHFAFTSVAIALFQFRMSLFGRAFPAFPCNQIQFREMWRSFQQADRRSAACQVTVP